MDKSEIIEYINTLIEWDKRETNKILDFLNEKNTADYQIKAYEQDIQRANEVKELLPKIINL